MTIEEIEADFIEVVAKERLFATESSVKYLSEGDQMTNKVSTTLLKPLPACILTREDSLKIVSFRP